MPLYARDSLGSKGMKMENSEPNEQPRKQEVWEHRAWVLLERLLGLIIFTALAFGVWNTLLRIENKQAEDSKRINETQLLIKAGMTEEQWQKATQSLNSLKHNSTP